MAETNYGVNDASAAKLWAKDTAIAERDTLDIAPLIGKDENSVIQIKSETSKGKGDRIRYNLFTRLTQDGKTEGETAEGQGEGLTNYYDELHINELGAIVAVPSENTIDQQRVEFDLRETAKNLSAKWWADRMSVTFFNQVCGNTAQTSTKYSGMNATSAPSSDRILRAGVATTDQGLISTEIFTLGLIDAAVEKAKVGNNKVNPIRIGGKLKYVMYLHPYQVRSMRTNTSTGQWLDIQKAALSGGSGANSPIYTGALGEYNNVILRESQDVPLGCNSSTPTTAVSNTRRAVLLGAQAAMLGYGRKHTGENRYRWNEELLDHKRKLEVSTWCICGMKKSVFNSQDFGAVVVTTYAAAA